MLTVILSFTIVLLCVLGMAAGALAGRTTIGGCCRDIERQDRADLPDAESCPLCGKRSST